MIEYFDPFSVGNDPFPAFASARAQGGFLSGAPPFPGIESAVYLFTWRLVDSALKHPRLLHAPPGTYQAVLLSTAGQHLLKVMVQSLVCADPPRHGIFRRPISQSMVPARSAVLTASLRNRALELVTSLTRTGGFDAVQDVALPLAMGLLGRLLGIPMPDAAVLRKATDAMVRAIDLRRTDSMGECHALEAHVVTTLAAGNVESDSLVAVMLAEESAGLWEREEVIVNIIFMMFAGQQTIIDAFGNALLALEAAPAQRALLEQGKVSWTRAADELLRISAPVNYASVRIATEDLDLEGNTVKCGTAVVPVISSANRDTAIWPAGDQLRLDTPGSAAMAFGTGIHACVGRHLARAEMAALLEALFTAAPNWSLDPSGIRFRDSRLFRGLTQAPVKVGATTKNSGRLQD
jgi:cytochrome P450